MKRLWRALTCLIRRDCAVFQGDAYTDWLNAQLHDSVQASTRLRRARETGNVLDDTIFPDPRRAQKRLNERPQP